MKNENKVYTLIFNWDKKDCFFRLEDDKGYTGHDAFDRLQDYEEIVSTGLESDYPTLRWNKEAIYAVTLQALNDEKIRHDAFKRDFVWNVRKMLSAIETAEESASRS